VKAVNRQLFLIEVFVVSCTIKVGGIQLYKKIRIILGVIVLLLAGFGLITKNFIAQPFMMLGLAAFIFIGGLDELQQGNKRRGYINLFLSVFVLFVVVKAFIA